MKKIYIILGRRGRITIPYEIRQRVGFKRDEVLSFTESEDGQAVTVRKERICDCQKSGQAGTGNEVTLYDFLNGLSPEQQRAALIHLSVKWAESQGGKGDAEA